MTEGKSSNGWLIVLALLWLALLGGAGALAVRTFTAPGAPPYHASDQAHDGLISYAQHCASCHGPDLEGAGAPALVGDAFLAGWAGRSVHDLLEYVRTQMPQGRGGTLADAAYERSTAYLLARNGFPGGDTPLRVGDARLVDLPLDPALATATAELPDVAAAGEAGDPAAGWAAEGAAADAGGVPPVPPAEAGVGEPAAAAARGAPVRALGTLPVYLAQARAQGREAGDDAPGGGAGDAPAEGGNGAGEGAGGGADEGGADVADPDARAGDEQGDAAPDDGAALFERSCAHCHGAEGGGGVGPALAGNAALEDAEGVIRQILEGGNGMPAFEGQLDVAQVAAVATHLRTRWGNDFGEVGRDAVAQVQDGEAADEDGGPDGGDAANGGGDEAAEPAVVLPDEGAVAAGGEGPGLPEAEAGDDGEAFEAFGEQLYARHCAACHAGDGSGGIGPSLVRNPRLDDAGWTIRRILVGANAMPAYGAVLSSEGVAAVTTYLRTQWGNDGEAVAPDAVATVAEGLTLAQLNPVAGVDLESAPLGQQRYVLWCSACHGMQGGGDVGPPLAGNAGLDDTQRVLTTLLYGSGLMPAYSLHPDEELAAIASYVRTSWSNTYGPVEPERVRQYRQGSDTGASGGDGAVGEADAARQDGGADPGDGAAAAQEDAAAPDDAPDDDAPDDDAPDDDAPDDDAPEDEESP